MNTADGRVIGPCMNKHRHQEWLRFLNLVCRSTPKDKGVHLICDTYATHKYDKVKAWQKRHPRFHYHFTPTNASWLNVAERTGFRGAEIEIFVDILVNPWND